MELYTRFQILYHGQHVDVPDWISWTPLVTDLRVDRMTKSCQTWSGRNDTPLFNNFIMLVSWEKFAGTNPNANIITFYLYSTFQWTYKLLLLLSQIAFDFTVFIQHYKQDYTMTNPSMYQPALPQTCHLSKSCISIIST